MLIVKSDKGYFYKRILSIYQQSAYLSIYLINIYLSRYMGLPTPEDNLRGYQASDVTAKAKKFANKKYLVVHGTAGLEYLFVLYSGVLLYSGILFYSGILLFSVIILCYYPVFWHYLIFWYSLVFWYCPIFWYSHIFW